MKKIILALTTLLAMSTGALAAGGGIAWDKAPVKTSDHASLQNGAKLFVNYCLNCHSAAFMRYNRLQDIGFTEQQIKDNLLFATDKVGETMRAAIDPKQAKEWFGANPPDLTLIARSRSAVGKGSGADYVYTMLRTYYPDDTKATGWNNLAFPNVGMPHVLYELQGEQVAKFAKEKDPHDPSKTIEKFVGFEQTKPGRMSKLEYDSAIADLVGFLVWMSEPVAAQRKQLGIAVLIFLGVFMLPCAWMLNRAYWKDIH